MGMGLHRGQRRLAYVDKTVKRWLVTLVCATGSRRDEQPLRTHTSHDANGVVRYAAADACAGGCTFLTAV